ncbi:MAG: 2-amino-4-hydroxy-6-hydroxymethyldihydropteridine diphosphokinase [Dehalococcoidia bacterium]|nr:2-amino-4-hydroxy-6-hydroxymethyldihydropteridine diphosphokinase [Dehalococcoidia bacterium]
MTRVYLGLGSNLGDRMGNLRTGRELLARHMIIEKASPVYETEPVGYVDQPLFLNAVISGTTCLEPFELLRAVKEIENAMGRKPSFRDAPREIDLDILFYGDLVQNLPELTIPHPRIADRAFVLFPLADINPRLVHPLLKVTVEELASGVHREGVRLYRGPDPEEVWGQHV